jgi:hypothetical protein
LLTPIAFSEIADILLLGKRWNRKGWNLKMPHARTAEDHLNLFIDLQNSLGKVLAPYEEFMLGGKTYYFSLGGFVYRNEDSGSEEERGYFCGYLNDDIWQYLEEGAT